MRAGITCWVISPACSGRTSYRVRGCGGGVLASSRVDIRSRRRVAPWRAPLRNVANPAAESPTATCAVSSSPGRPESALLSETGKIPFPIKPLAFFKSRVNDAEFQAARPEVCSSVVPNPAPMTTNAAERAAGNRGLLRGDPVAPSRVRLLGSDVVAFPCNQQEAAAGVRCQPVAATISSHRGAGLPGEGFPRALLTPGGALLRRW